MVFQTLIMYHMHCTSRIEIHHSVRINHRWVFLISNEWRVMALITVHGGGFNRVLDHGWNNPFANSSQCNVTNPLHILLSIFTNCTDFDREPVVLCPLCDGVCDELQPRYLVSGSDAIFLESPCSWELLSAQGNQPRLLQPGLAAETHIEEIVAVLEAEVVELQESAHTCWDVNQPRDMQVVAIRIQGFWRVDENALGCGDIHYLKTSSYIEIVKSRKNYVIFNNTKSCNTISLNEVIWQMVDCKSWRWKWKWKLSHHALSSLMLHRGMS